MPQRGTGLLGTTLGLMAEMRPGEGAGGAAGYEGAARMLEAALLRAPREPALLPQLAAALGRLGQVPAAGR
ncbi:hypothetical protein [Siccirubricoccus sp. G192]|uniref:hypothetical protein n=1 Tax=Siccirubricoccus sp. G192 TaxID=2849651 RepID=UPI001C2C84C7|nr:hypothetical protein [Siccirubricoccus sp. G192]MBV1800212.1 hypothetical protein [Siccirubricoccus sp. G192]